EDTEHGIQTSGDVVHSIEIYDSLRKERTDDILYFPTDFDLDGPLRDSPYLKPLKQLLHREKALNIPQLKAFRHYIWKRDEQDVDVMSEREGLLIPSLRESRLRRLEQVTLTRKHVRSSPGYSGKYGWSWRAATKPTVDTNIVAPPLQTTELQRQIKVRQQFHDIELQRNGVPMVLMRVNIGDIDDGNESDSKMDDVNHHVDVDNVGPKRVMTAAELSGMTNADMKKICKEWGLKRSGKKIDYERRLMDPFNDKHISKQSRFNKRRK
ncbi:MAG: SAP domain-containing protein, partial [Saprospiraceae bacterium]|nr:SAP domain-containing protein [Saprospiraceae bacterium]